MQAEGFLSRRERHPAALTAAVAINAAAVAALLLIRGDYIPKSPDIFITRHIPLTTPPPEVTPKPVDRVVEPPKTRPIPVPKPEVPIVSSEGPPVTTAYTDSFPISGGSITDGGTGLGGGTVIEPPAPPVLIAARVDPRHARDLQPPYPPRLQRLEIEGKVVVKVLIGTDGRVKDLQIVYADDDGFAEVTERQARAKWRFKPATRDGQPVESWKQLTLRFEIARG